MTYLSQAIEESMNATSCFARRRGDLGSSLQFEKGRMERKEGRKGERTLQKKKKQGTKKKIMDFVVTQFLKMFQNRKDGNINQKLKEKI